MYKLIIAEIAQKDLDDIAEYMALHLGNPTAAFNFLDMVERCYGILRRNPLIHELCQEPRLKNEGVRKAPINNYVLVYGVDEDAKAVHIFRFFHATQDYLKLI